MVAAIPPTTTGAASSAGTSRNHPPNPKNPSPLHRGDSKNPHRPPLIPSEKDNAAPRRPRSREISSRYLSSSPSSSSTSTSYTSSSSFSSSSSSSRRFPSPLMTPRPVTPPALQQTAARKRSQSVDRVRPADSHTAVAEPSATARVLCTTTRSLSVSFQGESFFYQTSRAKTISSSPARRPSPEGRRVGAAAATPVRAGDHSENSKPSENHRLWPGARTRASNPLMRSLDCSLERTDPILATVRLLRQSMVFEDATRRASFDGADLSASSDTDSVSSGSNSGTLDLGNQPRVKAMPRGISVPARFWQETNSRLRRLPESGSQLSPLSSRPMVLQKAALVKKLLVQSPLPPRGAARTSSPGKHMASPLGGTVGSLRATGANPTIPPSSQSANAPSIISFAAEVRRSRKGENRIEEAHMLRLLDNRYLQWRFVNAKISAAFLLQKVTAEKNLFEACNTISNLRDSITSRRSTLRILTQNSKLTSVLEGQLTYLDEWPVVDKDHSNSLTGVIEALNATTLRLPVVGGAKANILEMEHAVGSAVEVMQSMGFPICSLLSKVEEANSGISEIAKVAAEERTLLDQSRDLMSTAAVMHVTQCSLHSHLIQLKRKASHVHCRTEPAFCDC